MSFFGGGFPFGGFGYGGQDPREQRREVNNTKYYELIGVEKTATTDEIRKAYRRVAAKKHPDKGGDPNEVFYHSVRRNKPCLRSTN